jgi:hypothetical protein
MKYNPDVAIRTKSRNVAALRILLLVTVSIENIIITAEKIINMI